MMRSRHIFLLVLAFLLSSYLVSTISLTNPQIENTNNDEIASSQSLVCYFTPTGSGELRVNLTWYNNSISTYTHNNILVSSGEQFKTNQTTSVWYEDTSKTEVWVCSVTLFNETSSSIQNSSEITIINSAPTLSLSPDSITLNEGETFTTIATAVDADGDTISNWTLSHSFNTAPTLTGEDTDSIRNITFYPVFEDLNGQTQINKTATITVEDSEGTPSSSKTLRMTINLLNQAPYFNVSTPINVNCNESSTCSYTIIAGDRESNPVNISINDTSLFNLTTLTNFTASFSFIPSRSDVGIHTFNITLDDNQSVNNLNSTILTLNISSVDQAPNITAISNTDGIQNQSTQYNVTINATDIDGDNITLSIVNTGCSLNVSMWNFTQPPISNDTYASILVYFGQIENFTSNDYVLCRNVTFRATANGKTDQLNVLLNITNTNDAPIIYDQSYYAETSTSNQANISNLTAPKGIFFTYKVNGTDVDYLTYEGESWNFSINDTDLFSIDNETGILTSNNIINDTNYPNTNYSIQITITDDEGLTYNKTAILNILNNSIPEILNFTTTTCNESFECIKTLTASDGDEGENLTNTNSPDIDCLYQNPISETWTTCTINLTTELINETNTNLTWQINFTPTNAQVGTYNLTITVQDTYGAEDTETYTFNISNTNTAPTLYNNEARTETNISFEGYIVVLNSYTKSIYAYDDDLLYEQDNLTFSHNFTQGTLDSNKFHITKNSNTQALITIDPQSGDAGNYTVNLSVTDIEGLFSWQEVNFTIYNQSAPPDISQIKPYYNGTDTVEEYINIGSNTSETIYINENTTLTFGVNLSEEINHTFYWTWDNETTWNGSNNNTYTVAFDFYSSGNKTLLVEVEDNLFSRSNFTWNINIANVNRVPILVNQLQNYTGDSAITGVVNNWKIFQLDQNESKIFYDIDDDLDGNGVIDGDETNALTFSYNESTTCENFAAFVFSGEELTVSPISSGTCEIAFIATDPYNESVQSNTISMQIIKQTTTVTTTTSGGGGSSTTITRRVPTPETFQLVIPGIAAVYENGTVEIPISLKNTWGSTISGIKLSANASQEDLEMTFNDDLFLTLENGMELETTLIVKNYRVDAPLQINVSAYIESLSYTDTSTIYINALESSSIKSLEDIQTRISFARDLLTDNPECQELTEILNNAEKKIDTDPQHVWETINSVINGCKYLISESSSQTATPKSFLGKIGIYDGDLLNFNLITTIFTVLSFIAIIFGIIVKIKLKSI